MKTLIYLLVFALFLTFNNCFAQTTDAVKLKLNDHPIKGKNNIICSENSTITVTIDTAFITGNSGGSYFLVDLPTAADNKASYNQTPMRHPLDSKLEFQITNFKQGNIYHYRLIYQSMAVKKTKTIETTITSDDKVNSTKTSYDEDISTPSDDKVYRDIIIEPHDVYALQVSVGAYFSPARFPIYELEKIDSNNIIRNNDVNSTQGLMIGATYFFFGHDEKSWGNPEHNFFENHVLHPLGFYAGLAFSSQNKGLDNFLIGLNYGIRGANIIFGLNYMKINILKPGYVVDSKYNISGTDISNITESRYVSHLFVGGSVSAGIILNAVGILASIAGLN